MPLVGLFDAASIKGGRPTVRRLNAFVFLKVVDIGTCQSLTTYLLLIPIVQALNFKCAKCVSNAFVSARH